jgi:hypothetical protein
LGHGKRNQKSRQLNLSCKQTKIKPQIKTKLQLPKEKKNNIPDSFLLFPKIWNSWCRNRPGPNGKIVHFRVHK